MGLHIYFKKAGRENLSSFLGKFNELFGLEFKVDGPVDENFEQEFQLNIAENAGYLRINNRSDAKIFGDIEAELFPNKLDENGLQNFFDAVVNNHIPKDKLDDLFCEFKKDLHKAFIDIEGDGDKNPLDVLYEYDYSGNFLFYKLIQALKVLSEDSEDYEELYELVRENNRSLVSSRLWNNDKVREKSFAIARENNVVAQEGSLKLYAQDKEKIKAYYENMIDQILKPLFNNYVSIDDRIDKLFSS